MSCSNCFHYPKEFSLAGASKKCLNTTNPPFGMDNCWLSLERMLWKVSKFGCSLISNVSLVNIELCCHSDNCLAEHCWRIPYCFYVWALPSRDLCFAVEGFYGWSSRRPFQMTRLNVITFFNEIYKVEAKGTVTDSTWHCLFWQDGRASI